MGRQIPSNFCGKRNISRSGVSRSARRQRWMKWCEVRMVRVPLTMWLTTNPDLLFSGNLHFRAYGRSQPCVIIYAQRTFPISQHLKFVWVTWTSSQSRSQLPFFTSGAVSRIVIQLTLTASSSQVAQSAIGHKGISFKKTHYTSSLEYCSVVSKSSCQNQAHCDKRFPGASAHSSRAWRRQNSALAHQSPQHSKRSKAWFAGNPQGRTAKWSRVLLARCHISIRSGFHGIAINVTFMYSIWQTKNYAETVHTSSKLHET